MTTIVNLYKYLEDDYGNVVFSGLNWDAVESATDVIVTDLATGHVTLIPLMTNTGYANGISLELTNSEITLSIDSVLYTTEAEEEEHYPDTVDEYDFFEEEEGWK